MQLRQFVSEVALAIGECLQMRTFVVWMVFAAAAGSFGLGLSIGILRFSIVADTRGTLKDFQPLVASAVAFTGILIGALASFAKTVSDETARLEAGRAVEEALRQRAHVLLAEIAADAFVMLHDKTATFSPFCSAKHRALTRSRLEQAKRTIGQMHQDVAKVPLQSVVSTVRVLWAASTIAEQGEQLVAYLDEHAVDGDAKDENVIRIDAACIAIWGAMRVINPKIRHPWPARENAEYLNMLASWERERGGVIASLWRWLRERPDQ
jgi:hypothetical protein